MIDEMVGCTHTGVKLGAKQLNIFRIGCKTTQCFWIQSLINSYLCIKGIVRSLWHEGMFKARGTRAFKFPRAIIDNYARGTYNVLFYFIISKRFKQIFTIL
jgi:hypothetical protein